MCMIAMVEEELAGEVEVHVREVISEKVKVEDAIEGIIMLRLPMRNNISKE